MQFPLLAAVLSVQVAAFSATGIDYDAISVQSPLNPLVLAPACNCTGIDSTTANQTYHICNNATLGPQILPWRLPMLSLVSNYDRFGGLTPAEFLGKWWRPDGGWQYPNPTGFQLDACNKTISGNMTLLKGLRVDRFGEETGRYISAADAPFAQRALPPSALNVCSRPSVPCSPKDHPWSYHLYVVAQDFWALGGPIAPAFEQPGGGTQFFLGENRTVADLVKAKLLLPLNVSRVQPGPEETAKCGRNPVHCACERPA